MIEINEFLKENYIAIIHVIFVIVSVILAFLIVNAITLMASEGNIKTMKQIEKKNPELVHYESIMAIAITLLFYLIIISLDSLYWELEIEMQQFIF